MSPKTRWIAAILGLLGANVAGVVILIATSSARAAQVLPIEFTVDEPDTLGWTVSASGHIDGIDVAVTDRAGAPIGDAIVRVEGFQRAHGRESVALVLPPAAPGHYHVATLLRTGWYDLKIVVERGRDRHVEAIVAEIR
jgi:FixH protein